jgi:hypothetical protein
VKHEKDKAEDKLHAIKKEQKKLENAQEKVEKYERRLKINKKN